MKNTLLKIIRILMMIALVVTALGFLKSVVTTCEAERKLEKAKYERFVGDEIQIDGQTYTVTDYSIIDESFTISNGTTIAKSFLIKEEWD